MRALPDRVGPARRHRMALLLLAALAACGGGGAGDDRSGDAAKAPLSTPMAGATDSATLATPAGPARVRGDSVPGSADVIAEPLQWTGDAVLARLRDAGLAPATQGTVDPSPLGAPGLRVSVANGAAEVQAYVFGDPGAVGNATRGLDLGRLGAGGRTASLVVDNNLAAIVLAADEKVRERIRFALVARRGEGR